jgi:hypothetical protein
MKKSKMTASKLRGILSFLIVITLALSATGFYYAQGWLSKLAVSVSHTIADSTTSGNNVQALNKLQVELSSRQDIIARANNISISRQTYQTQAVGDLTSYARETGVSISNYTFPASDAAPATTASTPTTTITLTLGNPVSYVSLLKFMKAIEGSLPKMQILNINIGRVTGDSQSVRVDQLTVAISTR